MRLYFLTLATALVTAGYGLGVVLTGCSGKKPDCPVADLTYLAALAQRQVQNENSQPGGRQCRIVGNYGAGSFVLVEALCADGSYVEIGYRADMRVVQRTHTWRARDAKSRIKEEDIIVDLDAPQMEAWMLIDKRDHP